MNKLKNIIDRISQKSNILIAVTGVILLISLICVYLIPDSKISLLTACVACGLMNIIQGIKFMDNKNKKTTGWSMLTLGIIIIVVGFVIVRIS